MSSEKTDKDSKYFPRAWGAGGKRRSQRAATGGSEGREAPADKDQPQTAAQPDNPGPAPKKGVGRRGRAEGPPSENEARASSPDRDTGTETRLDPSSRDPLDSSLDDEALDGRESELDEEISGWLDGTTMDAPQDLAPSVLDRATPVEPPGAALAPRVSVQVVGIRFGYACRVYHFNAEDMHLAAGDWVIVKTEKGLGIGQVAIAPVQREIDSAQLEGLRKVIRKAGKADLEQKERCSQKEAEAYAYCVERIEVLRLPMKLVASECFFDGSKYVFYFTAEGRVDFRELVRQLVARFPVRIEMRQIGVRHEAKMTGGLACCGQELCCSRFLTDFKPVSVKMAKTQNLSLNPTKISGVCGRLMCCLAYEYETYESFRKGLPKVGKTLKTVKGEGVVVKHDPLKETVVIRIGESETIEITKDDIIVAEGSPPCKACAGKGAAVRDGDDSGDEVLETEAPEVS